MEMIVALIGLFGVILTALVSFMTTWRWGSLPRRMSEIVALAKDMPQERSRPLDQLLDDDIAEYVAHERRRREEIDSERLVLVIRLSWVIRMSLGAWLIAALVRAFLFPRLGLQEGDSAVNWLGGIAGVLAGTAIVAALLLFMRRRWRKQRRAAGRGTGATPPRNPPSDRP
ncbi:hypothetical protein QOZ88_14620 [Blastococcus sp. BMG 814]|uniref:Uncharacterized protein n=1 Tax=Blastococcus carthaginiensis TaxID=3050034 RepID=A0ABT9IE55_9ACTN|nr:hypothetical protein [Blastococcus carthaginiensis]MDP5183869.1 hypothetical protein [Blastococcus carthaginiensis]